MDSPSGEHFMGSMDSAGSVDRWRARPRSCDAVCCLLGTTEAGDKGEWTLVEDEDAGERQSLHA